MIKLARNLPIILPLLASGCISPVPTPPGAIPPDAVTSPVNTALSSGGHTLSHSPKAQSAADNTAADFDAPSGFSQATSKRKSPRSLSSSIAH